MKPATDHDLATQTLDQALDYRAMAKPHS